MHIYVTRKNDLDFDAPANLESDLVFLRLKIDGPLSMYAYKAYDTDDIMNHFEPVNTGADRQFIYCFQHRNRMLFTARSFDGPKFRKDWRFYFPDCPALLERIKNNEFTTRDSYKIVQEYNVCKTGLKSDK
jgi:hypothetical protein